MSTPQEGDFVRNKPQARAKLGTHIDMLENTLLPGDRLSGAR